MKVCELRCRPGCAPGVHRGENAHLVTRIVELTCQAEHLALHPSWNAQAVRTKERHPQDDACLSGPSGRDLLVARPVRLE
jgi:hypothetical protein